MEFVYAFLIGILMVFITTYVLYLKWLRSKYPAGPLPLPIIGNMHLLSRRPQFDLAKLSKHYGPIFTIWMGSQPTVVLCSAKVVKEALVEKGKEFAGKVMDSAALKLLTNENEDILSRQYDDKVIIMRKLLLHIMKAKGIGGLSILRVVNDEMQSLIGIIKDRCGRLEDPHFLMHFPVLNAMAKTVLNLRFQNTDDPKYLHWMERFKQFFSALELTMIINSWPALWYIPKMRKNIIDAGKVYDKFIDQYLTEHEETYQEGIIRDLTDVMIKALKDQKDDLPTSKQLQRVNIVGVIKDCFTGGTDTTTSAIVWSLLVLLHRPDINEKIQQELDQYLLQIKRPDADREDSNENKYNACIFTVSDRPHLPYLNAFIHEVLRRCTIGALASPRKALIDTCVGGMKIPKDATVVLNIHAAHMDVKVWEKPDQFIPERFLDTNGQFNTSEARKLMAFGGGPRNCVGEYLAKMEIFTCLANVLQKFELSCPSEANLPGIDDGVYQLDYSPVPFKMCFKLRPDFL